MLRIFKCTHLNKKFDIAGFSFGSNSGMIFKARIRDISFKKCAQPGAGGAVIELSPGAGTAITDSASAPDPYYFTKDLKKVYRKK